MTTANTNPVKMTAVSDLIESAAATGSVSVSIQPQDHRCRYWAKVVRATTALPDPSASRSANQVPGAYARRGEEELMAGDMLFEGEARHHVKDRGWTYHVSFMGSAGELVIISNPGAETKAAMKAAGLPVHLLTGSGEIAACVRVAHAVRLGIAYS